MNNTTKANLYGMVTGEVGATAKEMTMVEPWQNPEFSISIGNSSEIKAVGDDWLYKFL